MTVSRKTHVSENSPQEKNFKLEETSPSLKINAEPGGKDARMFEELGWETAKHAVRNSREFF